MPSLKPARIVTIYAVVSVLWILFSDNLAAYVFSASPEALLWASTLKGWLYVAVISGLLWTLLQRFESQSAVQALALRESEARYRSVIDNIADVFYRTDASGNLIMLSPSVAKLLRYDTAGELLGRTNDSFWKYPEQRAEFLAALNAHGEVRDYEVTLVRGDGTLIVVSTSSKYYHDAAGAVAGVEGIFRDITARKQAEDALRRNEERLRVIFETSPSAIFLVDGEGRIILANNRMVELFGFAQPELLGKPYLHLVSPEQRAQGTEAMRALMAGEVDHVSLERSYLRAGGSLFWGHLAGRRLVGDHGFEGLVGIITDITERKAAEDALKATHRLTNSILDSMPSAIIALDGDGRITHFNLSAQALCAMSPEEALGAPLARALPHFPLAPERLDASRREGATLRLEKEAFHSKAGTQLMDILVYPLDSAESQRTVVILNDVTERSRIEEIMVQTEKMISVGGLAAGMAHEINNPLSGILQSTQVMLNRLTNDAPATLAAAQEAGCDMEAIRAFLLKRGIVSMLQGVREAAGRAAHIVASMLEFSRKSESNHAPTDMNALLDKALELSASDYDLKKRYDFRHIRIERDYAQDLPRLRCSATQIQQVFMNLLRNAAQAMAERVADAPPPAIILRTRFEDDRVRIEVEDNGPGMDEAIRRKIFEPFFTTKTVGMGTGLGLSVSYFIVTSNHKGTLEVESKPGMGTKFVITLPLGGDG